MTNHLNRRSFNQQTSLAIGGLMTGGLAQGHAAASPELDAFGKRLLSLGLNALARAHAMDYFADGHRGAAIISAYLLCENNQLEPTTRTRVTQLIDLNWASTALCKPFPDTKPAPDRIDEIGKALVAGGDVLRQVGHNAIFAMLAVKAFRMLPEAATPERIDGVVKMIHAFTPWRDEEPDTDVDPPAFTDKAAASRFVLNEASTAIDRFVGFGQGFAGHMLTFGQSLVELAAMGDVAWAESCRTAFRKYVTVTRRGPEADSRRRPDHQPAELRPTDLEYWQKRPDRSLGLGHVFKYPYAYYELLRYAADPDLERVFDAKAYHVF